MPAPFSQAWLRALEPLVVGAAVPELVQPRSHVQLVCTDGERVRPWVVGLRGGAIRSVAHALPGDASVVIAHSVTVGWRLMGLSVRGFHRLDELGIEQFLGGGWSRHPMPPLDESVIDLSPRNHPSVIVWHERVIDSPLGTLFVSRRLAGGELRILAASTKPPPASDGVASDVAWQDVVAMRQPTVGINVAEPDVAARRAWRGPERDIRTIRAALLCGGHLPPPAQSNRAMRDNTFLDTLAVLRAMRRVLRSSLEWRELWRPSARRVER